MDETQQAFFKAGFDVAKEFCENIAQHAFSLAKGKAGEVAVDLNIGFQSYLSNHIDRFSKIKTLVNRHVPTNFLDIYVDSTIMVGKYLVPEKDIADTLLQNRLMILTGMAGCGKSMLIRRLFLRFLEQGRGYIPLFMTLRDLKPEENLADFLFAELQRPIKILNSDQYRYGLSVGKFLILLDGLDEVPPGDRARVSKQIIDISRSFPKIIILCTSRPDEAFIAWSEFTVGKVKPLSQVQFEELITKAPYDTEAKTRFLDLVRKELVSTHEVFLSNPLLCMMMLITYDEQKDIPIKMSSFYSLAYDVLYGTHDRSKGH